MIDKNNKLVGIIPIEEAKRKAKTSNLDLIMLNPDTDPPVCRISNYSEDLGEKFIKELISSEADKNEKLLNK